MASGKESDLLLREIAEYVTGTGQFDRSVLNAAALSLLDTLGCASAGLMHPECAKLIAPVVKGTVVPNGCRVPGTHLQLDPVQAAFSFGAALRWLDYNDTWLAKEWGHPSDNLAAILPLADYLSRLARSEADLRALGITGRSVGDLTMRCVLDAMVRAYEIQGVLSLSTSLNRRGYDHVFYVKVASAAVAARLLGASADEVEHAVSQAFADGGTLRAYRHQPNVGWRKSWAAGDAASRGVRFAVMSMQGEKGFPTVLTAPTWGVQDVMLGEEALQLAQPLQDYILPRILLKVSYPAEFHAQTALEAAILLHDGVLPRLTEIKQITISSHASAIRIIDKRGDLTNPADRDHCIQYVVAIGLLKGNLQASDYDDAVHNGDPRIDFLRDKTVVVEDERYSEDYMNPELRSVANRVRVEFSDGTYLEEEVEFPLGHPNRREEAIPALLRKWEDNVQGLFGAKRTYELKELFWSTNDWYDWNVSDFVDAWIPR